MSRVWLLVIVVLVLAGVGYYFMKGNQTTYVPTQQTTGTSETTTPADATKQPIKINEQNSSGEYGIVELREKKGKVVVTLSMAGGTPGVPQPAHIHVGKCPDVKAVAYPLTDVVDGKSVTTLDVTMAELDAKQPLAINVHKSIDEVKVYVACGNLALKATSTSPSPTEQTNIKY